MKLVDTKDAVGTVLCHDITQIIKGVTKDARFRKGHVVKEEDIPVLLSLYLERRIVYQVVPFDIRANRLRFGLNRHTSRISRNQKQNRDKTHQ